MLEEWKDIPEFEGLYQISSLGRVYSFKINQYLKAGLGNHGYMRVTLCKNCESKHYQVHRLVALAFIPNPENKPWVDHINGDKTDNRLENLKWATPLENNLNPISLERRRNHPNCGGKRPGAGRKRKIIPEYKPETNFSVGCSFAQREKLNAYWQLIKD